MKTLFKDSSLPKIIASNDKFLEIYEKLEFHKEAHKPIFGTFDPVESNANKFYSKFSLKLLDGKWGNFFYDSKILVVSSSRIELDFRNNFKSILEIHSFQKTISQDKSNKWLPLVRFSLILVNENHKFDESVEKASSAFARSCIKKISLMDNPSSVVLYLNQLSQSRKEFI